MRCPIVFMRCPVLSPDLQFIGAGHYCLPEEDSDVSFLPLSQQIDREFLSFLKHGRSLATNSPGRDSDQYAYSPVPSTTVAVNIDGAGICYNRDVETRVQICMSEQIVHF